MAFKNPFFIFFLFTVFSLFSLSSQSHYHHHHHHNRRTTKLSPSLPRTVTFEISTSRSHAVPVTMSFQSRFPFRPPLRPNGPGRKPGRMPRLIAGAEWIVLQRSLGISAMHMQLLYNNRVVIFDRTDFGPSNLSLPAGEKCRYNDEAIPVDCTAHALLYDVASNTFRPLTVQTDVWCSSGAVSPDGTLVQTGGYHAGNKKIRLFTPCNDVSCDWVELVQNLTVQRWYASNHILPDGQIIIVGGRRAFSYEFFPKNISNFDVYYLNFLRETNDPGEENNLYPFLHLLPDGNLYIFANRRSILLDYVKNKVIREFPAIPGEKRSYPSTGSSVMLPIRLVGDGSGPLPAVEVMICGGAPGGSFFKALKQIFSPASKSCGRLRVTDPEPQWVMEEMPMNRVMPDMLLLPTGDVLILNGASRGTAGWESAVDPVLYPVLYMPNEPDLELRFGVLAPTTIPRMYHSSATLLTDGRILVGGSNPHVQYRFTGVEYPTELSLEAFSPHYMDQAHSHLRPSILSVEGPMGNIVSYGQKLSITFSMAFQGDDRGFTVTMAAPSFTTHSFAMNQRLLVLDIVEIQQLSGLSGKVTVHAPASRNIAPPGYYMLFLVHVGIPGQSVWIKMS